MGVKNLWDILECCKKTLPLYHLQNKRLCVDLSCWMVQLQNVNKSHCCMKDKLYLKSLFHRLRALIALNCRLIFVTDGSIPALKISTYKRRLKSGSEVTQDETSSRKESSLRRNMGSEFSCMIKEAKVLGLALGIPCLDGIEEAEAQCGLLNSESLCDGCFTSDSDVFLFGARTVYRDICLGEGGYVVCYEMSDIERKLGFGRNSLITLALLLGSDYFQGVHGLGPESACQIVKSIGDDAILRKIASEGLSFAKKSKANGENSQGDDQFMQVIDAYLKPKCHSADSDVVHRAFSLHLFQRFKLHQICAQFFEWSPNKTDEYILPKIAERDLRQFAQLRHSSSELGLWLPLDKMPVKCPVSGIVKQRKVQGKECYEVYWEEIDGLKTSIAPADLVRSACPERILEFEERGAQRKKPNHGRPRGKISETKKSINNIDLKLQELLLGIELGSSATQKACLSMGTTSENAHVIAADHLENLNPLHRTEPNGNIHRNASRVCLASSNVGVTEVVDLLSPSPSMKTRDISKCQQADAQCIDVIDLSESENEISPEHSRKARELRLFLASIREDI